mgnify:CR=1 FL=1
MIRRYFSKYLNFTSRVAQFLRFATVGAKISLIDIGGLYFLTWFWGLDFYTARGISLSLALLTGYLLNRYFTFGGHRRGHFFKQLFRHCGVHLLGSALNFGVYSYVITHGGHFSDKALPLLPLLGIIIGGVVGMSFNFFFSIKLVFPKQKSPPEVLEENVEASDLTTPQPKSPR